MKIHHFSLALLMACIFGFNYSAIKLSLTSFDQTIVAALRLSLCAIPAIFYVEFPKAEFKYVLAYGTCYSAGLILVISSIAAGLSVGLAATILQLGIVMTAIIGVLILKEPISAYNVIGLSVSAVGLFVMSNVEDGTVSAKGMTYALTAALFWALANYFIKKSNTRNPLAFVAWSGLLPAFVLFSWFFILKDQNPFIYVQHALNLHSALSIIYQAYINTLVGYYIWVKLLTNYRLTVSAPTYILVPGFSFLFSRWIYNEPIGGEKIIAVALTIAGVIINTRCNWLISKSPVARKQNE